MKNIKINKFFKQIAIFPIIIIGLIYACSDDDNFIDVVPDTAKAIIRSLKINNEFATIDHTSATITQTLPAGTSLSALVVEMDLPLGTNVTPASGETIDFSSGPVTFKTSAENGASREYTATIAAYGDPKILSFSIGNNTGIIDDSNNTVTIEIGSQDGDITDLTPNFVIPTGTSVDIASGVSRNFSNPVKYTVLSNNGFTAKQYTVTVNQIQAPQITSFAINGVNGIIDQDNETIQLLLDTSNDISSLTPTIEVPNGQTVNPTSGSTLDFTNPVTFTVTNTENLTKEYIATVEIDDPLIAFIGTEDNVASLLDDDAKAAATWMESKYGNSFRYLKVSDITSSVLDEIDVAVIYYLTPQENLGYSATSTDVLTLLPVELRTGAAQAEALKSWVKNGGDLLLAGEATPFIFSLGRVPADFSQPRGPSNYTYSEFGCADTGGCVDTGKAADDIWGLGMRDTNNSQNRRDHPIFNGLTFENGEFLALQNSATREVRLIWWQHFDGVLNPSCCGQDAALFFEQTMSATKFGTLSFIGDAFGYGAVEWKRTDQNTDANFDNNISADFKGHVFSIENTIIGYEWDSNGTTNDYQGNIEKFTENIISYLASLDND
ncbi:DUF4960 domain-containing protein [Polaribacter sp.]|uniref:DUF4960 domain-containing protein n=1 Tax=Polaribacter sp. TaxID=1920175 RepID=UPI003F6A3253